MSAFTGWTIAIAVICIAGLAKTAFDLRRQSEDENLYYDYCEHFNNLISNPDSEDTNEDRDWLLVHSHPMNDLLGSYGIAYQQIRGRLSIPVHLVPELCHELHEFSLTPVINEESCKAVITCLGQFQGILIQKRDQLTRNLKNPLRWLSEGIRFVLSLPIFVFESVGLVTNESMHRVISSRIMNVLTGIASIITIIGFIIQLLRFFGVV